MEGMKNRHENDFERIRSDHRSEVAEDYLEAIAEFIGQKGQCRGVDLARNFSVSHATVTQTLVRLQDAGLVETQPYGRVLLTRRGQRVARKSRERPEIVLSFLLSMGVCEGVAAADAEGI
jgi:DtxR family manganese transport transcriptional regulator